jgi:chaperone BCS1
VYGYFEAETLETIQKFFETATEYTRNMVSTNKTKDKVKVLNFDYRWECDCLVNKKSFNSIHLPTKILNDFKSDIENFLSSETKKRYEELELTPSRIYALYGPPGTGKTTLIHTTASHYSMNIATLSFDNQMNDRTFRMALKKIPVNTILCLEDIDCLFREDRKSAESYITFSGIINALDGICKIKNVIIFLTTNHLPKLDPALKRRIDYFIKFDFCTKEQVKEMFTRFLPNNDFDMFWSKCSKLKVTPSILQKFFICNLHKKFEDYYSKIKDFTESEYGLEKLPDMYT